MSLNGKPLKNIRELQGLSRLELAQKSGISESTIKNIEYGNGNPGYDTLVLLADALEVPLDILCNRNLYKYLVSYDQDGNATIKYDSDEDRMKLARLITYLQVKNDYEK